MVSTLQYTYMAEGHPRMGGEKKQHSTDSLPGLKLHLCLISQTEKAVRDPAKENINA